MMRQNLKLLILMAVAALNAGCGGCADVKDGTAGDAGPADFEQRMRVADSLYNSMQFRASAEQKHKFVGNSWKLHVKKNDYRKKCCNFTAVII